MCAAYLAVILFIAALAVTSVWFAVRLLRQGNLSKWRRRVLVLLLVLGGVLGLYATIGPVALTTETGVLGFPFPIAMLARMPGGMWIDHPVYGGVLIFPPINFVFWMGLFVAPINIAEVLRRRRAKHAE